MRRKTRVAAEVPNLRLLKAAKVAGARGEGSTTRSVTRATAKQAASPAEEEAKADAAKARATAAREEAAKKAAVAAAAMEAAAQTAEGSRTPHSTSVAGNQRVEVQELGACGHASAGCCSCWLKANLLCRRPTPYASVRRSP